MGPLITLPLRHRYAYMLNLMPGPIIFMSLLPKPMVQWLLVLLMILQPVTYSFMLTDWSIQLTAYIQWLDSSNSNVLAMPTIYLSGNQFPSHPQIVNGSDIGLAFRRAMKFVA